MKGPQYSRVPFSFPFAGFIFTDRFRRRGRLKNTAFSFLVREKYIDYYEREGVFSHLLFVLEEASLPTRFSK